MNKNTVLGIDVGGTGIKGALVDVKSGQLISERFRVPTPQPADVGEVADTFTQVVRHFDWSGLVGCGFPAIIKKGVAHTAANISSSWIGTNVESVFSQASNCSVLVKNDADMAGVAELEFGAGKGFAGVALLITIGTGLGTALFIDGQLVPNSEFGHLYLKGIVAEKFVSGTIRKKEQLSWKEWGNRLDNYLKHINRILSPDLIILGGGTSKKFDEYKGWLTVETEVVPADLRNHAGIIGAAVYGHSFQANLQKSS